MFDKLIKLSEEKELLGLTDELKGMYIYKYFKEKKRKHYICNSNII